MNNQPIENLIEAALFFRGGALSINELAKAIGESPEQTEAGVAILAASLGGRGLAVVREGNRVALGTAPYAHAMIEKMRRDELDGPLGKAGLETLAIVIFRGPLSRADIEYVRGVNCTSILRSLLIRGLIERVENQNDKRSFLYQATPDVPAYFGVATLTELPRYQEFKDEIEKVFAERTAAEATNAESEDSPVE